jgi:hypothetical protein
MLCCAYLIRLGIPNKCGESTHDQSKLKTLDYDQVQFLILARHLAIQITIKRNTTLKMVKYCDAN